MDYAVLLLRGDLKMKTTEYDISTMGGRVREQRLRNNLSQDELARLLGTTRERINRIENDRDKTWTDSISIFAGLVNTLDTSEHYILTGKSNRPNFSSTKAIRQNLHRTIKHGFMGEFDFREKIWDKEVLAQLHVKLDDFFDKKNEKIENRTLLEAVRDALFENVYAHTMHIPPREEYDEQKRLLALAEKEIQENDEKDEYKKTKDAAVKIKDCIEELRLLSLPKEEVNKFFYLPPLLAEYFRYIFEGRKIKISGVDIDSFVLSDFVDALYKSPLGRNVCTIGDAVALNDRMDAGNTYDWVSLLNDTYDNEHPFIIPPIELDDDEGASMSAQYDWEQDRLSLFSRGKILRAYRERMDRLGM